ncbi:MAG: LLM class flavin-dependent oxidoreductase [Actinomycetota bacterium]|nr:LLM class flavin-dependent oxidoreductase [Actinomycetota bacterium]
MEYWLFLPQMRFSMDELVSRAQGAESAGFDGIALMDHLAPPMAEHQPMYDAITTATWIAANTQRLSISHLVLCDAMRHPAVLAKQAVTLDHASNGRFELGIGWGSVPAELEAFGVADSSARSRVTRLGETLEILKALWSGEPVTFEGEHFRLSGAQQLPVPSRPIPIVIGGSGKQTLQLVKRHADWWNVPLSALARVPELREQAGDARGSAQIMVALVPDEGARSEVTELATRRFGAYGDGLVIGTASEVAERCDAYAAQGIERLYLWFADFATPMTLEQFGSGIIKRTP